MSNTSSSSLKLKHVIHNLQLRLLDEIQSETQLILSGSLLSKPDYHDVVIERSLAQTCGYPLCNNSLSSPDPLKKGRYSISLKQHKVFDLLETRMYCSTKCLIESRVFKESLPDERLLELDGGKVERVVRVFEMEGEVGLDGFGDLGLGELSVKENENEGRRDGIVSMEEWVGLYDQKTIFL